MYTTRKFWHQNGVNLCASISIKKDEVKQTYTFNWEQDKITWGSHFEFFLLLTNMKIVIFKNIWLNQEDRMWPTLVKSFIYFRRRMRTLAIIIGKALLNWSMDEKETLQRQKLIQINIKHNVYLYIYER